MVDINDWILIDYREGQKNGLILTLSVLAAIPKSYYKEKFLSKVCLYGAA